MLSHCSLVILCALALTHLSTQQQKPSGASVIRGRVIYADTGRPLRRAEVTLIEQDTETWLGNEVTDRNGEFTFDGVSAGRYFLMVRALDIVTWDQPSRSGSLSRKIALGQIEDGFSEVTVDGRTSVKTEIRAIRGGVITGRVLTETEEPIAKAQIRLFQVEKNGRLRLALTPEALSDEDKWWLETDSRGVYRIAGLPSGEYIVRASESNEGGNPDDAEEGSYTNGSMMAVFYPKAVRVKDATSVTVLKGTETKDVDIRFPERLGHRISGTLVLKGKPVSWAWIKLSRDEPDGDLTRLNFDQARSDTQGQWEIRSVPDGNYTLTISGDIVGGYVRSGEDQGYVSVAPLQREVIVAGTDQTNLKFELAEGTHVRGVISVEGGAQLPAPLRISLVSPEPDSGESESDEKTVGSSFVEKGAFLISALPSGSFEFRIGGLGTSHYVKSITHNGKDLLRNPIKVEEKNLDGVRIVLASDRVSLSGRVVDKGDKSKPLIDAAVLLFPVEAERRRIGDGPIAARSDKAGRFVVKAAPGEYFVVVLERGQKDVPMAVPTETSLIKNSSTLQKLVVQRGDEKKIVEVTGPSQP